MVSLVKFQWWMKKLVKDLKNMGIWEKVKGEIVERQGDIADIVGIPQHIKDIYKTKTNYLGEVSCRYKINKVFLQSTFAFGKFVNSNFAVQYEF